MEKKKIRCLHIYRDLAPVSVVKRAPMGFMGMRGKKEYDFADLGGQDGYSFAMQVITNIFEYIVFILTHSLLLAKLVTPIPF